MPKTLICACVTNYPQVARPSTGKPAPGSARGSFDEFVDDDLDTLKTGGDTEFSRGFGSKPSTSRAVKGSFQVYTDEGAPRNVDKCNPKSKPVSKPSGFSIFVDEDVASQPVRKARLGASTRR